MLTGKQSAARNHSRSNEAVERLYALKKRFWAQNKRSRNSDFLNSREVELKK